MPEQEEFNYTLDDMEILDSNPNTQEGEDTSVSDEVTPTYEGDTTDNTDESDTGLQEDENTDSDSTDISDEGIDDAGQTIEDENVEDEEFTLQEGQLETIISQEFDGKTIDEIKELINTPQQQEPTFESEEEKKLFEFIKNNNPNNFNQGAQEFYRLQDLDVDSLTKDGDFKSVLFEKFKLENRDVTGDKAKRLFESEYKSQYPNLNKEADELNDELTESQEIEAIRLERDGMKAAVYINEQKESTLSTETANADLQTAQDQERMKTEWDNNVDAIMEGFEGFELNEGDSKFNFVVENQAEISDMMKDSNKFWEKLADDQGMIQPELVQEAFAFMTNKDQLIASSIEHGINIGREQLSNEVNNSSKNDSKDSGQGSSTGNPTATTNREAIMASILGGDIYNGPR